MSSSSIETNPSFRSPDMGKKKKKKKSQLRRAASAAEATRVEDEMSAAAAWPRRTRSGVMLEGYLGSDGGEQGSDGGEGSVGRTKSLTDEDLEELKGCLDLGFGFSYDEIPELCGTLPALELCYSMSQRFLLDDSSNRSPPEPAGEEPAPPPPIANWRISSPGDDPDDVKARLKYWAQAVACTVKLCS